VKNPTLSIGADGSISSPNRPAPRQEYAPESLARSDQKRNNNSFGGGRDDRGPRSDRGGPSARGSREHREEMKNNPFAGLAGLKDALKSKN
jgi:hypothetical protein